MAGTTINEDSIAFIGFGEAARAFLDGWRTNPGFKARVSAYDIKTDSPDMQVRAAKRADYAAAMSLARRPRPKQSTGAEAVFSVVTADQAHQAALAALPGLRKGALFFDCDSCAPQTKTRTARSCRSRRRALCRRRGDGGGPSAPASHPASDQRPPRRSRGAGARRPRHVGQNPCWPGRRRLFRQDDPLDHDEGPRGAGLRMRAGRGEGGRDRDGARFARRHLPRLRLAEALGLYARAGDDPRASGAPRKCARSRSPSICSASRARCRAPRYTGSKRSANSACARPKRRPPTTGFWPTGFSPRSILAAARSEAYEGRSFASLSGEANVAAILRCNSCRSANIKAEREDP